MNALNNAVYVSQNAPLFANEKDPLFPFFPLLCFLYKTPLMS